tara:strand:+ start:483 stop:962 length:480 start_codon:yes stop_codon:yes gene_type:complete
MKKIKHFIILTILFISCSNHNNQKTNEYIPDIVDLEGNEIKLEEEKGNVIILNLWATWCKPCIAEFESLEKSKEKFIGKKVKIFAISNEKIDEIKEFINKRKFDLNFLKLNNDLSFFNAYSLPTTIIFNKNGDEEFRINSGVDFTSNKFIDKIIDLEKL